MNWSRGALQPKTQLRPYVLACPKGKNLCQIWKVLRAAISVRIAWPLHSLPLCPPQRTQLNFLLMLALHGFAFGSLFVSPHGSNSVHHLIGNLGVLAVLRFQPAF